jgi:hypothetical protein
MNFLEVVKISTGRKAIVDLVEAGQFIVGAQILQDRFNDALPEDYLGTLSPGATAEVQDILSTNGITDFADGKLEQAYFLPKNDRAIFFVTENPETGAITGLVRVFSDETAVNRWKQTYGSLR